MLRHISNHVVGRGQRVQGTDQVLQIAVARTRRNCFSASTSALATQRWIIWPPRHRLTFRV